MSKFTIWMHIEKETDFGTQDYDIESFGPEFATLDAAREYLAQCIQPPQEAAGADDSALAGQQPKYPATQPLTALRRAYTAILRQSSGVRWDCNAELIELRQAIADLSGVPPQEVQDDHEDAAIRSRRF